MPKIMKRIFALILTLVMLLSLAACSTNQPQPTEVVETEPATEEVTETEPTEDVMPTIPEEVDIKWTPMPSTDAPGDVAEINTSLTSKVVNFFYFIVNDGVMYIRWTEQPGYVKREASERMGFTDTFSDPQNITKVVIQEKIKLKTGLNLFAGFTNLTEIEGVELLDMGGATNLYGMFKDCKSLTTLDVSNFNTTRATTFEQMFMGCESLTNLDVSNWKTSKVTTTTSMFAHCKSLEALDVSQWDVSSLTTMDYMFACCENLAELDVSTWNITPIDTHNMFYDCKSLTTLDVSNFNMSQLKSSVSMFAGCDALTNLVIPATNGNEIENKPAILMYGENEEVKCEIILPDCNVEMR